MLPKLLERAWDFPLDSRAHARSRKRDQITSSRCQRLSSTSLPLLGQGWRDPDDADVPGRRAPPLRQYEPGEQLAP